MGVIKIVKESENEEFLRKKSREVTEITPLTECTFSNTQSSVYAEYSYKDGETVYRVYQVIAVSGGSMLAQKGFVMTYTAREDLYEVHMDEFKKMMEKIKF